MPNERSNVKFPLWRKKMDGSMFNDRCTVIPKWVVDNVFKIRGRFPEKEKNHPMSQAFISINRGKGKFTRHTATVTTSPRGGLPVMRLYFEEDVVSWLKEAFKMTYLRDNERKSYGLNGPTIESLIPFWEFIDIEWEEETSTFHFTAWYTQDEISHTLPGQELQYVPPPNEDEHDSTESQMESGPFEFGPTLMGPCVELCIEELGLRFVGKEGQFRFFRMKNGNIVYLKYSKYYQEQEKERKFWYTITPSQIKRMKLHGVSHMCLILSNYGSLLLSQEALDICIENAEKVTENGHITQHHIWATASDSPQLWNSQAQINVELEWNRFQNTEPQESSESNEDEYSDMPDWFRDMD